MSLTENSNQLFLPGGGGGATNSQNSPYISVWPLHYIGFLSIIKKNKTFSLKTIKEGMDNERQISYCPASQE